MFTYRDKRWYIRYNVSSKLIVISRLIKENLECKTLGITWPDSLKDMATNYDKSKHSGMKASIK